MNLTKMKFDEEKTPKQRDKANFYLERQGFDRIIERPASENMSSPYFIDSSPNKSDSNSALK